MSQLSICYPDGFFRTLFDHMQIGAIVTDGSGIITYINQTYARFLNIDKQKALGRHATELGFQHPPAYRR